MLVETVGIGAVHFELAQLEHLLQRKRIDLVAQVLLHRSAQELQDLRRLFDLDTRR